MAGQSWVTLATNDSYGLGALVLGNSLQRVNTSRQLTVLVTPGVSGPMRSQLSAVFNIVQEVNVLDSRDEANLALLSRPELGVTFTKLHCWRLTQFSKCVFLDADTLVLQNSDELFDREELSAAPDAGWPDCFNSGVFVFQPSLDTFKAITSFAVTHGSFDGGDQGLLNMFFSDWATKDISRHLPFIYNMCSTATYSYLPAYKQYGESVKIVHFIGVCKPWLQYLDSETRQVKPSPGSEHLRDLLQLWWDIFCSRVHPSLSPDMAGLAGAFSQLTLGVPRSAEQTALEEHLRKQAWEHGHADYMGRDAFDNIWRKICETLAEAPQRTVEASPQQSKSASAETNPSPQQSVTVEVKPDTTTEAAKSEPESAQVPASAPVEFAPVLTKPTPVSPLTEPMPVLAPTEPTPTPAQTPAEPTLLAPAPTEPTLLAPAPTEPMLTPVPAEPAPVPAVPAPMPAEPAPVPADPAPVPADPAPVPADPAPVPAEPAPVPAELAPVPAEPAPVPAEPAPVPAEPAPVPAEPAPVPAEPAPVPIPTSAELAPAPVPIPTPAEPAPVLPIPTPAEPMPIPAPAETAPVPSPAEPAPVPSPTEPTPVPALAEPEPTPAPIPAEPVIVQASTEPAPIQAPAVAKPAPESVPAPAEPKPAPVSIASPPTPEAITPSSSLLTATSTPTPADSTIAPTFEPAQSSPSKPARVPQTPTVTAATPPTSPPIGPIPVVPSGEALKVEPVTPETPPVVSSPLQLPSQPTVAVPEASAAPVPPKRRGGAKAAAATAAGDQGAGSKPAQASKSAQPFKPSKGAQKGKK